MCREVCSSIVSVQRGALVGTNKNPVQVNEVRFAGQRKFNRGRFLVGDYPALSEDSDTEIDNARNHGQRIDGPWVFGLLNSEELQYFVVERRNHNTSIPIVQREEQHGSTIHSDEWPAYANLANLGYTDLTVNHQHNYVDPESGAHTRGIERSWLEEKMKIMRSRRSVPRQHLQSHLDYFAWKYIRKNEKDLFVSFLRDIRTVYM
ncbi:hypothetical protein RN001_013186 [Aquatica leii]|uniref:ISXO2-like transposase domain-containing protein n=1 Tax=Aquatica leii TaxID=1421715 RepID=A0AAN7S6W0_9COLE|nr:hypothetical protein RN001_013186 [Aquatica leii]